MKTLLRFLLLACLFPTHAFAGGYIDSITTGQLGIKQGTAPSSPASGYDWLYILSADGKLYVKDSAGTAHLVPFSGAIVNADLSGSAGITNANLAAMGSNTVKCNPTGGSATPSDCTGSQILTIAGAFANPLTTLGDIMYENATPAAARLAGNTSSTKKFLSQTGTGTVSAVPAWGQPACADLSNASASCSTDATNASNISSGTLGLARGGTNADLSATGGTSQVLKQSALHVITVAQLACSDLSNGAASCSTDTTNASNISSGTLPAARLPTPTVSTLGGMLVDTCLAHNFVTATTTSGDITCTQPAFSDISGTLGLSAGGTGQTTAAAAFTSFYESKATTLGDLVYGGASGAPTRLAGDTSNTRKFLREVSSAGVAAAPAWDTLQSGDIPDISGTYLTKANNLSDVASASTAFTNLYESKATTLGDLVYGGASGAPTRLAGDTTNTKKFLTGQSSGGVAAAPAWNTIAAADVPTLNQNTTGSAGSLSTTFTSNVPLFGQGTGVPTVGTVTGNTTKVATSTGTLTSGNCAKWDASGNIVDAGAACGGSSTSPGKYGGTMVGAGGGWTNGSSTTYADFSAATTSNTLTQLVSSSITCTAKADKTPAIDCTLPNTGYYMVCASGTGTSNGSNAAMFRLTDNAGTPVVINGGQEANVSTSQGGPFSLCGMYNAASTSVTFKLQGAATAGNASVWQDSQRPITWMVYGGI